MSTPIQEPDSATSTETKPRPARPIQRIGRSFKVAFQLLLFVVVVASANYLSCARHHRIDLTEKHDFTLSDMSKKLIASDRVQKRIKPIRIIAVIRRSSPHYARMFNLLDEYQSQGGKAIKLEFVDPARQTDRALEIANTYKQAYTEDMIIIDGRTKSPTAQTVPEIPESTTKTPQRTNNKNLSAHVRTVRVKNLYIEKIDQFKQRYIAAWQDEDIISSSILKALEGTPRKIYFAVDKTNLEASDGRPAWRVLAEMLWQQNILLEPLSLTDTDSVPEDASGFALIAPQYDLDAREIKIITDYWDRTSSSMLVTLDPKVKLDNLRIFLRNYGITPRNDRVTTVKSKQTLSNVRAIFTRGPEINIDLGGKSTVFDGSTCSLEVREDDDQLTNRRVVPIALVQAADGWWGETRYNEEHASFNAEEDTTAPLYIAAAVLRGQAQSDATKNLISKMVVIGNTDFLASDHTRPEQADFIKSTTNWLMGREELIGIGPRQLYRHKITLLDSHSGFINKILLFFLPAIALLTSLIVWNMRKA